MESNLKNFLIGMITSAVRDIKENIFKVEVRNQIEIPKEIEVKNLKEIQKVSGEVEVKKIDEVIGNLEEIKNKEIKFPDPPKPLEEIKVKDFDKLINKKEKDIIIPDRVKIENLGGVIHLLEDIKNKKIPEPKETKIPDNFKISNLDEIPRAEKNDDLIAAIKNIGSLNRNSENPIAVRLSDGKYFYKALTELVERTIAGGGASIVGLRNKLNVKINPATEEQQVAIIAKELIGNSAVDGSGSTHHAVVDNAGRFHTRGFRDAAGNGRRMLVDADRHGQVDVLSLPDVLSFGTNEILEVGTDTFICKEKSDGTWYIMKIDTDNVFTHATHTNNPSINSYADARSGYAGLTYQTYDNAF